jgi:hypothetical protein
MESWCPALKIMSGDIGSSVRFFVISLVIGDVVFSKMLSLVDDSVSIGSEFGISSIYDTFELNTLLSMSFKLN